MDAIGAEVGQKMRSAIKAKLMELGCYVDDELPDYIMVMVANKRSKSQMEDDLQLFLRSDTKVFVEWLQQVLKKLKQVTITNPEVCNSFKELKRKATMEIVEVAIKKEKKEKRKPEKSTRTVELIAQTPVKSLTDDIPVQAQHLVEKRNKINRVRDVKTESQSSSNNVVHEDNFDIPSLAEVNALEDSQLAIVEHKMKEARNRIVLMKSDSEDDDDFINIKADGEDLLNNELDSVKDKSNTRINPTNTNRILNLKRLNSGKNIHSKPPMCERLGARITQREAETSRKSNENEGQRTRNKISLVETLREEQILSGRIRSTIQSIAKPVENKTLKKRESVHKRLGLPSAVVSLPKKVETIEQVQNKTVLSVVQVKPRRNVPGVCQANKKLLLLAVAEAQKSIALTPVVGKPDNSSALFTKKYREKNKQTKSNESKESDDATAETLKNIIVQVKRKTKEENTETDGVEVESNEYIPETISKQQQTEINSDDEYIPSLVDLNYDEDLDDFIESNNEISTSQKSESEKPTNHQFIVTLDGLKDKKFYSSSGNDETEEVLLRKPPSPIVFNKEGNGRSASKVTSVTSNNIPDTLTPIKTKQKERCKYWPNCRLKDSCDFFHPTAACKMFPMCKFGDRCLYIHPKCKFDASCTRKDCPYSHIVVAAAAAVAKVSSKIGIVAGPTPKYHTTLETCKYFPNCSNPHCLFYHPKPCRFGQFCLNKNECNFSHGHIPNKEKLTWHSKNGR